MSKEIKKIAIVDAGKDTTFVHAILDFVKDKYELIEVHPTKADYIFHSCMGNEVLKYNGVRIFLTGECVTPDFNICDYAMGFDHIQFGDRYCRLPLIKLFKDAYSTFLRPRPDPQEILNRKTGFCAYVMSNTKNSAPEREKIFNALCEYKQVDSGGKWKNNVGGPVADKIEFQSKYKFVLAIENYSHPGYLTEKFAQAAQSNAVPIYWGDPTIVDTFNPQSFINCHDFSSMEALVSCICVLDQDYEAICTMLTEPWFNQEEEPIEWQDATFTKFLCHIFNQSHKLAYRRNRSRWGIKTERRRVQKLFQFFKRS
jgi:hypothetical protein